MLFDYMCSITVAFIVFILVALGLDELRLPIGTVIYIASAAFVIALSFLNGIYSAGRNIVRALRWIERK